LVGLKESFKNNNYWASEISRDLQQSLPILSLEDAEARTNAINKGDLQKVAKKYLNLDARIQLVLMPEASSPKEE
jgi:predicted Zn-dependent peptidase